MKKAKSRRAGKRYAQQIYNKLFEKIMAQRRAEEKARFLRAIYEEMKEKNGQ